MGMASVGKRTPQRAMLLYIIAAIIPITPCMFNCLQHSKGTAQLWSQIVTGLMPKKRRHAAIMSAVFAEY
jgi:hypothetical protein